MAYSGSHTNRPTLAMDYREYRREDDWNPYLVWGFFEGVRLPNQTLFEQTKLKEAFPRVERMKRLRSESTNDLPEASTGAPLPSELSPESTPLYNNNNNNDDEQRHSAFNPFLYLVQLQLLQPHLPPRELFALRLVCKFLKDNIHLKVSKTSYLIFPYRLLFDGNNWISRDILRKKLLQSLIPPIILIN